MDIKYANPTILARMSEKELSSYLCMDMDMSHIIVCGDEVYGYA